MLCYEMDARRVFTGISKEFGPREPIPRNWTYIEPPETDGYAIFDGVKWFTRDEYPHPPTPMPEPEQRRITVGAFYDRFGDQKWAILSSSNPLVAALIQDVSVRRFIDLDDPQLPGGLDMLVQAGIEVDVEQILTAPVKDRERL
ncbi:hypothetical protein LOS15_07410 [Halomonas sp. 7T]|uniref:hypothetical protein n=1 Tax=Halomonas sp. 7T TaxID=2893469 RepID=UPI0021DAE46D|nr:hypothetical protein [Halomonas sp. 7T]UXZ55838.1 hypothetical protein LOS15_07410 [Halomonas sp. 7T]